jgi:hypothetical protein
MSSRQLPSGLSPTLQERGLRPAIDANGRVARDPGANHRVVLAIGGSASRPISSISRAADAPNILERTLGNVSPTGTADRYQYTGTYHGEPGSIAKTSRRWENWSGGSICGRCHPFLCRTLKAAHGPGRLAEHRRVRGLSRRCRVVYRRPRRFLHRVRRTERRLTHQLSTDGHKPAVSPGVGCHGGEHLRQSRFRTSSDRPQSACDLLIHAEVFSACDNPSERKHQAVRELLVPCFQALSVTCRDALHRPYGWNTRSTKVIDKAIRKFRTDESGCIGCPL